MNCVEVGSHGFVKYIDHMGSDHSICAAARQSYGATRPESEDRHLIRYLMRHRHTSPFEMAELIVQVKAPIYIARQWLRHRTASVNEYSMRYSPAIEDMESASGWRLQAANNKQGSDGFIFDEDLAASLSESETHVYVACLEHYHALIDVGVAREQARKVLPLATYTIFTWKIDLHNLLHFLSLRMDPHAQLEIQQYAQAIAGLVKERWPLTWEAFVDYRLESRTFSRMEREVLAKMLAGQQVPDCALVGREYQEFLAKLGRM